VERRQRRHLISIVRAVPAGRAAANGMMRAASVAGMLAALGGPAAAFTFVRQIGGIPVNDGSALIEPFTGGLNSPKPNLADVDADGDLDLLIVQPGGGITHYRNNGTPAQFSYRFVADNLQNIDANTWATLADIDADGDLDLFTDGNGFVVFHRNVGGPTNPVWQFVTSSFEGITNSGFGNTPNFVDIDGDVDLDYLEMEQNFGTGRYYRNDGSAQVPNYNFVTNTFGCIDTFDPGLRETGAEAAGERDQHGISVISTVNIDADSDLDIFIGDLTNPNLWYFRNDPPGVCGNSCQPTTVCYTRVTQDYLPITTFGINQARFGDLDDDNDFDLVMGVTNQNAVLDNLIHFINIGTPQVADFQPVDLNLIKAIDIGRRAQPAVGDLDGDGDKDLFLGAEDGTIHPYWNTGTPTAPSFVRGDSLIDGLGATIDVGFGSSPALIDHEGDGDLDLFVGRQSPAQVRFYRNEGTAQSMSLRLRNTQFGNVQGDFNSTPALGDLDDDGDLDLLVGEFGSTGNPRLFYVRNDGTTQSPVWVTVCDNTPNTCVFAERVFDGDLAPELYDLDGDDDLDLLLGERLGNVNFYRNIGTKQSFVFELETESFGGVEVGLESATEVVDINGDGRRDLFVGETNGGLNYYRRVQDIGIDEPEPQAPAAGRLIEVRPNPARSGSGAIVDLEVAAAGSARVAFYSADGRLVRTLLEGRLSAGPHRLTWDGRDQGGQPLPAGVYFVKLELGGRTVATKLAVTR
jgi:hypothetical protein